jgi:hypothetical protein
MEDFEPWLSIETMPFGQQVLLLWLGGDPVPHYEITMGRISPNDEWKREEYWSGCGEYRSMEKIVGWLPLPPFPSSELKAEGQNPQ